MSSQLLVLRPTLTRRLFSTTRPRLSELPTAALASRVKKRPYGAFRGGIFGFLLGSTTVALAGYLYVYDEYKTNSEFLGEDIDALRTAIQRIEVHVRGLEDAIAEAAAAKTRK